MINLKQLEEEVRKYPHVAGSVLQSKGWDVTSPEQKKFKKMLELI